MAHSNNKDRRPSTLATARMDELLKDHWLRQSFLPSHASGQKSRSGDDFISTSDFHFACRLIHDLRHNELLGGDLNAPVGQQPAIGQHDSVLHGLRIIPHLLQHRRYRSEVTAISYYFERDSNPPQLKVVFAKGKSLTDDDLKRAESIVQMVRENVTAEWEVFLEKIMTFLATHSAAKFGWLCRKDIIAHRELGKHIDMRCFWMRTPVSWLADFNGVVGDGILQAIFDKDGEPSSFALRSGLLKFVYTIYDSQLKTTPADLSIICCCAFHIRHSFLFRMLIAELKDESIKQHASDVIESLEVLAEYFEASRSLWELFRYDARARDSVSMFDLVPIPDLTEIETKKLSEKLTFDGFGTPTQDEDTIAKNNRTGYFDFIKRRAYHLGIPAGEVEAWTNAFPSLPHNPRAASDSVVAEVKVALYLLKCGLEDAREISMSDSSSLITKYWFKSLNETLTTKGMRAFSIPPTDTRVGCIHWMLPGVDLVDKRLKERVIRHADILHDDFRRQRIVEWAVNMEES